MQLSLKEVATRLESLPKSLPPGQPEWAGASVCLLLDHQALFLTIRSDKMPTHAGQVAFIGGYKKAGEEHPFEVARREFTEETGLPVKYLQCLGVLPAVYTAHDRLIVPVVCRLGLSQEQFWSQCRPNGEWDEGMAVPIEILCDESAWSHVERKTLTQSTSLVFFPLVSPLIKRYASSGKPAVLWGATARMVWHFLKTCSGP